MKLVVVRFAAAVMAVLFVALGLRASGAGAGDAIPSFDGATGWINSKPLRADDLRGKVVLVDFWEYTCVNCLRTLPYLRAWYDRYHDDGLVIVGVHTPEFGFSGDPGNVGDAVKRLDIAWPVALDKDDAIWKRFQNDAWPKEYLYDQHGALVESQAGEGNYQATESKIQSLLREQNPALRLPSVMALLPQDSYDKPGAVCYPQTAETYVGPWHGQTIANAGALNNVSGDSIYEDSGSGHVDGSIYLQGYWHTEPQGQAMISGGSDSALNIRYHAIQVIAVMKLENGGAIRVNITQDGNAIAREDAGSDIHYDGSGASSITVGAPRAYELLMNAKFGQHDLRLLPQRFGVGVYSFAFESCEVPAHT
jgi:thiol-disulfide isomerase/thioredoxin